MIRVSKLMAAMGHGDLVVVNPSGSVVEMTVPEGVGPTTIVVRPVTDALKLGDAGLLTASVDRDQTWAVDAFILGRAVVSGLDQEELTADELISAVEGAGHSWQVYEPVSE